MADLLVILVSAIFVNNFVLARFLGICPFLGVSKKVETALGMGMAVTFVMTVATVVTWFVQYFVLIPFGIEYLQTIAFILVIASLVQFVEMFLKKSIPALYAGLGIFLPLITTNCAILFACLTVMTNIVGVENPEEAWDLGRALALGIFGGVGFTIAIVIMAGIREELDLCDLPAPFKGTAITLVVGGILAMAFMGFAGMARP